MAQIKTLVLNKEEILPRTTAKAVNYDNSISGLNSSTTQAAIDEIMNMGLLSSNKGEQVEKPILINADSLGGFPAEEYAKKNETLSKVTEFTNGNLVIFNESGELQDGRRSINDFALAPLNQNLTLYVNADTGNDSNDGLSAESSKRTLTATLGLIPKNLNSKSVTINTIGSFSEQLRLYGFFGGSIKISGDDKTFLTNGINVTYCTAYIWLKNLNISGNVYGDVIDISYSTCATVERCNIDATNATQRIGIMASNCPALSVIFGTIDNAAVACMSRLSVINAYNISGNTNDVGYQAGNLNTATAGFIFIYSSKMTASIETKKEVGGIIFKDGVIV